MEKQPRGIQSIEVGGRLLNALVAHAQPMTLKDLAAAADMAPAQAHGYLASYRRTGLVEQESASGHYQLGPLATRLATARLLDVTKTLSANHGQSLKAGLAEKER
ncbi:helix-turn-helix domain-containing protein [Amorphus sp. 3PC139-8]|uniref:helix-turn-helix domain-containing protein n=1 Tax=Amorphus sp. 3PC139-8 TaxID=2735676 RepID=UPI00345D2FAC